jgi:NTP pyrophosphatase (non-canonical NTP hydrolase)
MDHTDKEYIQGVIDRMSAMDRQQFLNKLRDTYMSDNGTYELNHYQVASARTLIPTDQIKPPTADELAILWNALGLAGEAGEFANKVKKQIFHQHGLNIYALIDELGDIMWYMAALCTVLKVPMSVMGIQNVNKLEERFPNGWDFNQSLDVENKKNQGLLEH